MPDNKQGDAPINKLNLQKMSEAIDKALNSMTKEDWERMFPEKPKGWISIEDELPMVYALDYFKKGFTEFKVKDNAGKEFTSRVCDGNTWLYEVAKPLNITHWYRD